MSLQDQRTQDQLNRIERELSYLTDLFIRYGVNDPAEVVKLTAQLKASRDALQTSIEKASPK